jgi:hypothetical protein
MKNTSVELDYYLKYSTDPLLYALYPNYLYYCKSQFLLLDPQA